MNMLEKTKLNDVLGAVREGLAEGKDPEGLKEDIYAFLPSLVTVVEMMYGKDAVIKTLTDALSEAMELLLDHEVEKFEQGAKSDE